MKASHTVPIISNRHAFSTYIKLLQVLTIWSFMLWGLWRWLETLDKPSPQPYMAQQLIQTCPSNFWENISSQTLRGGRTLSAWTRKDVLPVAMLKLPQIWHGHHWDHLDIITTHLGWDLSQLKTGPHSSGSPGLLRRSSVTCTPSAPFQHQGQETVSRTLAEVLTTFFGLSHLAWDSSH